MHKCGVRVCLAVTIPSLEAGCMPVIDSLTLQKTAEQFQIPLVLAFAFSSSMYKNGMLFFTYLFQKTADFLKVLRCAFFCYKERLQILLIQQPDRLLDVQEHLFFPFSNGFLPYKRIFIGGCFQLGPINEYGFF